MSGPTPTRMQLFLRRALQRLLPDDAWSEEFLTELDQELSKKVAEGVRGGATFWYMKELVSLRTFDFVRAVRARDRKKRKGSNMERAGVLSGTAQDLRQAWKSVSRDVGVAGLIVLTLAAGIGSVTAMYGLAERLFLAGPAHVSAPDELVRAFLAFDDAGGTRTSPWIPYNTARAIQDGATTLSDITLYRLPEDLADFGERVRPVALGEVDGHYFDVLGAVPEVGRFFRGDLGLDPEAAVLSHSVAIAEFGSAQAALGRAINVAGSSRSVVGVAPLGFAGPDLDRVDVWIPLDLRMAGNRNWWMVGRRHADLTVGAARSEAQAIHERQDPGRSFQWARDGTIELAGIRTDLSGERTVETSIAGLLLAMVALVLLIAWANVLNLLLARMTRRRSEVFVLLALGIGRWRLLRLLLAESFLLSLAGGVFSLPVAFGEGILVRRLLLPDVAWSTAVLDTRLAIVTCCVVFLTGTLLGLVPARSAIGTDLAGGVSSGRGGSPRGQARAQAILATSQLTFSAALLLCAGLFIKSFWAIRVTDLGVDADRVSVVNLRSTDASFAPGAVGEAEVYNRAYRALQAREDGSRVALSVGIPFLMNFGMSVHVDGRDSIPELPGGGPFVSAISGGYFETLGTTILQGVGITDDDVARQAQITVVGQATARALWPGDQAIGQCVRIGAPTDPCVTVVGISEDVHRQGYREDRSLQFYIPLGSTSSFSGSTLLIRPARAGGAFESRLAADLSGVDPAIAYVEVRRLDSFIEAEIRPWRLGATMLTMVGVLAILMSVGGVFGVLTYVVAQRRREIGVRLALGATDASIRTLVLRLGMTVAGVGVVLGFAGVLASSPWLVPLLFETSVADPMVMLGVGAALFAVASMACLLPAQQAARVDPVTSLRTEV